ncbi:MAG: 50S ribosomal protein L32 [Actinobacteria bacterium QS_5_72_10]|nr:MAG: 50S ribosomal protein L32 [Actinobacteria bacterium QS_8_72_14]PSO51309.1 MAG: 50S ribosomal protein L32 [Actinobacteria bacterium QS_5_72_10]
MAVPKRKTSRARTRHRKAQWLRARRPHIATCPRCKEPREPHTVCPSCGTYRGRQVLSEE